MTGPELHHVLREHLPGIAALYMSGSPSTIAVDRQVTDLLAKPFSPATLVRRLREMLGARPRQDSP
jgi:hypothetical protein